MNMPVAPSSSSSPAPLPFEQRFVAHYPGAGENVVSAYARYALAVLLRHKWLALAIVLAFVVAAAAYTLTQTPQYFAMATVQINDRGDEVLGEEIDQDLSGPSDWDVDRFLNTQLDILRSRMLSERVANALGLTNDPAFFAAMGAEGIPDDETARLEQAIAFLQSGLLVDLPYSSRVARIGFESADPAISARVANAFAEQFIEASLQRRFDSSAYAREFVSNQLEEARADLEESERALNDYARGAGIIRGGAGSDANASMAGGSVTSSSLMQLNDAANQARARRIASEAEWRELRSTPLLASGVELANPTIQALMTRKSQIEADLQTARARYLPDHPAIARLEADLRGVERQLESAASNVRRAVQADYRAALSAERNLRAQVDALRGQTMAEQDRAVQYDILAREADTARSIYDGLLQRFRELTASAGVASSNIAIIDRASIPSGPSSPNLPFNMLLALALGSVAAAIVVFLRDQFDDVIHVPEDVEAKLGVPLLGIIPRSVSGDPLLELEKARSPIAEAYNSLRGSLLYSTPQGVPRILGIISAQPGEGKSTTSLALAQGFARLGKRVLLIDGDLRRPSVHRLTGVDNSMGLTDILTGQTAMPAAIRHSEKAGLDVLPSGPLPPSPPELLSSANMAQVLEDAASNYDLVIVDGPPVMGLADATILSAIVDATILVVEAERGRSGYLKVALRRLRAMQPVLLGAVVAKFDPEKAGNRYSTYADYDYYQYALADKTGGQDTPPRIAEAA